MMSRLARSAAVALCALLAACQTFGWHQFVIPAAHRDVVVAQVVQVARAHGMLDCLPESDVVGALGCFRSGDTSFTFIGVRHVDAGVVVDISFRSAGIGGELYKRVSNELRVGLQRACGAAAVRDVDGQQIPLTRVSTLGRLPPSDGLTTPASSPRP